MTQQIVPLGEGGAVIIDELGSEAIETRPAGELAVVLELGGKINKRDERWNGKFLFSIGQAAEMLASVVVAVTRTGSDAARLFDEALEREQDRLRALDEEHEG